MRYNKTDKRETVVKLDCSNAGFTMGEELVERSFIFLFCIWHIKDDY